MRSRRGNFKGRVDRELFHQWLWDTRSRGDIVSYTQLEMAKIFKCGRQTPARVIAELIAAGKVKRLRHGKFQVIDPELTVVLD